MSAEACPICGGASTSRQITVRSGKTVAAFHCAACTFDFFSHDPTGDLAADQLDKSRLEAAGLDIPPIEKDFENGLRQSAPYLTEYMDGSDVGRPVLEIGCSWGYFLQLGRDAGSAPHGVELNTVRARYVENHLKIPCDTSLEGCEARGIRFKKIFLFYVLEYVPNPVQYLQRLVNLLDEDGAVIGITPNLIDPLKDLWLNEAFGRFFYDEHAINYFSPRAMERTLRLLSTGGFEMTTRQGYSVANHISWYLTNGPRTTGVVGGDNFIRDIAARLNSHDRKKVAVGEGREIDVAKAAAGLAELLATFDASYKRYLEDNLLGNQIRFTIGK